MLFVLSALFLKLSIHSSQIGGEALAAQAGISHAGQGPAAISVDQLPPAIASLLKPAIYHRVIDDRSVMTHATLQGAADPANCGFRPQLTAEPCRDYSFYAVMLVHASLQKCRAILTDYSIYAKLIPYIDKAVYDPRTHLLDLSGGIWKFVLHSVLRFEERGERWIHYEVAGGHFRGMVGDIFFETLPNPGGESLTLVYLRGDVKGFIWPPQLIIEQGAQIVFEFTAKRMRSYIESAKGSVYERREANPPEPRPSP